MGCVRKSCKTDPGAPVGMGEWPEHRQRGPPNSYEDYWADKMTGPLSCHKGKRPLLDRSSLLHMGCSLCGGRRNKLILECFDTSYRHVCSSSLTATLSVSTVHYYSKHFPTLPCFLLGDSNQAFLIKRDLLFLSGKNPKNIQFCSLHANVGFVGSFNHHLLLPFEIRAMSSSLLLS